MSFIGIGIGVWAKQKPSGGVPPPPVTFRVKTRAGDLVKTRAGDYVRWR